MFNQFWKIGEKAESVLEAPKDKTIFLDFHYGKLATTSKPGIVPLWVRSNQLRLWATVIIPSGQGSSSFLRENSSNRSTTLSSIRQSVIRLDYIGSAAMLNQGRRSKNVKKHLAIYILQHDLLNLSHLKWNTLVGIQLLISKLRRKPLMPCTEALEDDQPHLQTFNLAASLRMKMSFRPLLRQILVLTML